MTSMLLRASAGTGKTTRLVQTYVDWVVRDGLRPSEIFAVTFTVKAAEELRDRIHAALRDAGVGTALLLELESAPIGNFHSLAWELLRNSGLEVVGVEGATVLGEAGEDAALFCAAAETAWFEGSCAMHEHVQAVAPFFDLEDLATDLWVAVGKAREDGCATFHFGADDAGAARASLHEKLTALRERLIVSNASADAARRSLQALRETLAPSPTAQLDAWLEGWRQVGRHINRRSPEIRRLCSDEAWGLFSDGIDAVAAADVHQRAAPHLNALAESAWATYVGRKRIERAFDFADLLERCVELYLQRPALHRRLRGRVKAVLVDEAQDTNRLQRRFVRLLAGLDGPAAMEVPPAALWVVGDRKQAIYTFRGADPAAFEALADDVASLGGARDTLSESFRSTASLVRGINGLGAELFGGAYEPLVKQGPADGGAIYYLEVDAAGVVGEARAIAEWIAGSARRAGGVAVLLRSMAHGPLFARALADRGIPVMIAGGGGLYSRAEVQDVAAMLTWLCDSNERLAAAVALRSPLVGLTESGLVSAFLDDPQGKRLRALQRGDVPAGLDADDAQALGLLAGELPGLVRAARTLSAAEFLAHLDARLHVHAAYVAGADGEQALASLERVAELADAYDRRKGLGVYGFARELAARIEARHAEPPALPVGGERFVTVGTIHQAKGLQYETVLLADLHHGAAPQRQCVLYDRDVGFVAKPRHDGTACRTARWLGAMERLQASESAEQRRLLYVAVTRAREEVVFVGPPLQAREPKNGTMASVIVPWVRRVALEPERLVEVKRWQPPAPAAWAGPESVADTTSLADAQAAWQWAQPPDLPSGSRLDLPVTVMASFDACLRRGFFLHALGLADGWQPAVSEVPANRLGDAAHKVLAALERLDRHVTTDAFIAAELRGQGLDVDAPPLAALRADLRRLLDSEWGRGVRRLPQRAAEVPFLMDIAADTDGRFRGVVHGQIDLVYDDGAGPVLVDFKYANTSKADGYTPQLEAYATALARILGLRGDLRTELVFFKGDVEVVRSVITGQQRAAWQRRAGGIVTHLALASGKRAHWPGQERERCVAMQCGFVARCHPEATTAPATPVGQLSLF